jgi:hypothetical protein
VKARPYAWAVVTGVYALCSLTALAVGVYNVFGLDNRSVGIGLIVVALLVGGVTALLAHRCRIELAKREYERTANLRTSAK